MRSRGKRIQGGGSNIIQLIIRCGERGGVDDRGWLPEKSRMGHHYDEHRPCIGCRNLTRMVTGVERPRKRKRICDASVSATREARNHNEVVAAYERA